MTDAAKTKAERLARALRDNLRRRKAPPTPPEPASSGVDQSLLEGDRR